MECRFSVEAKTFSFSAQSGRSDIRLEEKRKSFRGFIFLGIKCSEWLVVAMEEAIETQRKEVFARSFRDEVRVVKIRMGNNKAGYFLETAVFVEGARKGTIRIPEGRGGWGWQRFVDELCLLNAQLSVKAPPTVPVPSAGVVGSQPTFAEVLAAPPGGALSSCVEAQASLEASSGLGRELSMGGGSCLMEALRTLAMEFLSKVRAEVDRVLFFGLGLRTKASMDIRRRLGQMLSRLGLKPKLLHGFKLRGRRKSSVSRVKPIGGGERILVHALGTSGGDGSMGSGAEGSDEGVGPLPAKLSSPSEEVAKLEMGKSESSCSEEVPLGPDEVMPEISDSYGEVFRADRNGTAQIVPGTILTATEAAYLPEMTSPKFALVLEVAQSPPASQIVPETRLPSTEGVEVSQIPMDPTQAVLLSPELAQTAPVLVPPELPSIVEERGRVLPVPKAQLLVNGLTETQDWYLGWLREGTQNPALLGVIGCFEVGTRRKNEVAPPPICPDELPKLKAKLAGIRDDDRENEIRKWALSIAASLGMC
jgi:hypothetical protein